MMQYGHSLGGEQSGHIIFSKYAVTGDGVLTSLMLMEVMLEKKQKLSELRKGLTIYPQLLKNVRVGISRQPKTIRMWWQLLRRSQRHWAITVVS